MSGVPRAGQQVRFRSGEGDHGLVEAVARRRPGARVGVAESDSYAADIVSGVRHQLEHSVREVSREDAGLLVERRTGARRQDWISWHLWISETKSGGIDLGRLSRLADGSHVGHAVSRVSREAAAAGESGGQSNWNVDRRLHGPAGGAVGGGGARD